MLMATLTFHFELECWLHIVSLACSDIVPSCIITLHITEMNAAIFDVDPVFIDNAFLFVNEVLVCWRVGGELQLVTATFFQTEHRSSAQLRESIDSCICT